MARDAVDAAARSLGGSVAPSCTERTPLVGAEGYEALWNRRARLAAEWGLQVARVERLLGRYGARAPRGARDDARASPSSRARSPAPTTTSPPRSATPRRTRARSTSTTCSRAARASRSRPSTAASRARARSRTCSATCSAGARSTASARWRTTRRASARSARARQQRDDQTADAARLGAPDVRLGAGPRLARARSGGARTRPNALSRRGAPAGTRPQAGSNVHRSRYVRSMSWTRSAAPGGAAAVPGAKSHVALPRDRAARGGAPRLLRRRPPSSRTPSTRRTRRTGSRSRRSPSTPRTCATTSSRPRPRRTCSATLETLQERSQRSFRDLLEPYSAGRPAAPLRPEPLPGPRRGDRRAAGPKGRGELERIAARYPEDVARRCSARAARATA